jgi:hypothetical protein
VIGNGAPHFIAGFRETTGYPGPILTDPSLAVFRAAELRRGLRTVLTLGTALRTVGSLRRGYRQGATAGDALQQGGTLVIARDGRILYHHISDGPGDYAPSAAIEEALSGGGRVAASG